VNHEGKHEGSLVVTAAVIGELTETEALGLSSVALIVSGSVEPGARSLFGHVTVNVAACAVAACSEPLPDTPE
jgi:hypothetical protein